MRKFTREELATIADRIEDAFGSAIEDSNILANEGDADKVYGHAQELRKQIVRYLVKQWEAGL